MPDINDNEIDALRGFLSLSARHSFNTIPSDVADRYHHALAALVAERDALKTRVMELTGDLNVLVADRSVSTERLDAAKQRIAELEAQPPAASDLRERLDIIIPWMKKATTMLCDARRLHKDECFDLVNHCDDAIAAMRKGEANAE